MRLCAAGIPCELVRHWDPAQPLLVGGLAAEEVGRGFMQLRLKRHRWFPKVAPTPHLMSIHHQHFLFASASWIFCNSHALAEISSHGWHA